MSVTEQIAGLDTRVFATVESQTTEDDQKSLLAVHHAVASRGPFSYLEIGSHLGGTLQAVLADPRCTRVVSIDPRPTWQPDDRVELDGWAYEDNSTERMLELLASVPGADLSKIETVEESTENIAPGRFPRSDLCFIDGEHTYAAALRDARFCRAVSQGAGVIAFHDYGVIDGAVLDFLRETPRPHRGYWLRSEVYVVELGCFPTLLNDPRLRSQLARPRASTLANRVGADTLMAAAEQQRRGRPAVRRLLGGL